MLKPAIESRRRRGPTLLVSLAFVSGALVGVGGSLVGFLLAPHRVVIVDEPRPARIPAVARVAGPASLTAKVSPRYRSLDLLSPGDYTANGNVDEVVDVELTSSLAVKHIFLNGNGGAHQWDTVIGDAPIPFGRVFGGHRGEATWHLGVRENGQWRTDPNNGSLREVSAGTHHLELIGDGAYDGPGPRTVTVMFVDGTTVTAAVQQIAPTGCYASQGGGCAGNGNAN